MSARDLLHQLLNAGFALDVTDSKLLVNPASRLTGEVRAAIRACKPELLALVAAESDDENEDSEARAAIMKVDGGIPHAEVKAATKACAACRHLTRAKTCREPVRAGLLTAGEGFGVVWPMQGQGTACPALMGKRHTETADGLQRVPNDDVDGYHTPRLDDADMAAFKARTARFAMLGRTDADELAERLTQRDRDGDDRRLCLECTWLGETGKCLAATTWRIPGADRQLEPVQTILHRCGAFGLRKGLS